MTSNPSITSLSLTFFSILLFLANPTSSQACKSSCGRLPIHYPFGTGPGCGSPKFQPHVSCSDSETLLFTSRTGLYPIQSIDYTNQVLYIDDPSMSTCSACNPSTGFSLDWDAPFTFIDGDIFALLDCSSTNTTLCDTANAAPVCSLLYSCVAISALAAPFSTCCVYTPVSLGPSFEMDLKKLKCGSYAGVYSFDGRETDPEGWKFGIALKYRFSVDDGYPRDCADCEKSNGVCGYNGEFNSFACNCGNGMTTTTNCYFPSWSHGSRLALWPIRFGLTFLWCGAMIWIML